MDNFSITALVGICVSLAIKELYSSGARRTIHKRIDTLDKKYTQKVLCDERSKNIEDKLDVISKDVKSLLIGDKEKKIDKK